MPAIDSIRDLVRAGGYRIKPHATRHMLEEGFDESHIVEALIDGVVLEDYVDENRCLVVGRFHWSKGVTDLLHVVCDTTEPGRVEVVTAYLPRMPAWVTPWQRG